MAKKQIPCQSCSQLFDKSEAFFIDEETFAFSSTPSKTAVPGCYCPTCYEAVVRPELENYEETLAKAENVNVFFSSQGKESRFVRRIEKPISVTDCRDRDEVVMRLAFLAAQAGKNVLVDVDISSAKIRNGGWQSSTWSGKAIPALIDESALQRRFAGAPN